MILKTHKIISPSKRSRLAKAGWCVGFGLSLVSALPASAQNLPGSADASRVMPANNAALLAQPVRRPVPQQEPVPQTQLPPEAAEITMKLEGINLHGVKAFNAKEIQKLYQPLIGKTIKLSEVWGISEKITSYYRDHGYFLSRAYVPQQEIGNGVVTINVVEGYIGKVVLDDPMANQRLIKDLSTQIVEERPAKAEKLEELVLRLNDLPGHNFRSILKPLENGPEGATQLVLIPSAEDARGVVNFGNSGSRFLGPYIANATVQNSFIDMQETTLSVASASQPDELRYSTLMHEITLTPSVTLALTGNFVSAHPGYTLRPEDIKSNSTQLTAKLNYKIIRQWQRNMTLGLALDGRNSNSDILDTPLTRDRVRALRETLDYDFVDESNAYNALNVTLSQGLSILSNSESGDFYLSRGEAVPDFKKFEASYKQQRYLTDKILATGQVAGQYSSDPLFSSEEFGYGGQVFGRAYDSSEITGDKGVAGSIELGYTGLPRLPKLNMTPFIFYDIGKVWNNDTGSKPVSASSAGGGMHMIYNSSWSLDLTIAQPLTKDIETPLYTDNGKNPRYMFQMNKTF